MWKPTAEEMFVAQGIVLADQVPACPAMLIHASPIQNAGLDRALIERCVRARNDGLVSKIVINGLKTGVCQENNLAYSGREIFLHILHELGVPREDIIVLKSSFHTKVESQRFLRLAREYGWSSLVISDQPHKQLRCFLAIIASMDEVGFWPDVYNLPGPAIPLHLRMKKPVLRGVEPVDGTILDHLVAEFKRIVQYAQEPEVINGVPKFLRNATIPEMFAYLEHRGKR